jgi:hypothetical protein
MANYDGQTIEILNWDKYNPRKDIKATNWVRLQNSLFEDPNFIDFSHSEILFWIYLLSMGSKKQTGLIKLSLRHADRIGRFSERDVKSAIAKLIELGCVRIVNQSTNADVTQTSRTQHATDGRTDETNETDETDVDSSEQETSGFQLAAIPEFSHSTRLLKIFQERRVTADAQKAWLDAYPDPPWVEQQILKAVAWEIANPKKRKKNFAHFINNWLSRDWDKHRSTLPSNPVRKSIADLLEADTA